MRKRVWSMKKSEVGRWLQRETWNREEKVLIVGLLEPEEVLRLSNNVATVAVMSEDRSAIVALGKELGRAQLNQQILLVNAPLVASPWLDDSFDRMIVMVEDKSMGTADVEACERILRPGCQLTVLQKVEVDGHQDLTPDLVVGGFESIRSSAQPSWHHPETVVYQASTVKSEI